MRWAAVGLVLLAVLPLAAPAPAGAQRRAAVMADALSAHVRELADDRYAGRAPGTPGGEAAAAYVAAQFAAVGLRPVGREDFLYPVTLARVRVATAAVQSGPRVVGAGVIAQPASAQPGLGATGPLWRASAKAPATPPPAGAVVVLQLPAAQDEAWAALQAVRSTARAAGAAALIVATVGAPDDPLWKRLEADWAGPVTVLPDRPLLPVAAVSAAAARSLFAGGELDGAPGLLGREGGVILTQAVERFTSSNVVGLLTGRGNRAREHLVVTAHWDHLGRCAPTGPDPICNGAIDNASGVGGLIALAGAMARGPRPARSILFVATTAEEDGLLGARAFTAAPPVPLASIVGGFNLDTIAARGAPGPVTVLGEGLTTLDPLVARAARAAGRTIVANPAVQPFFRRSDNWAFVEAGVPVLGVTSIFPAAGEDSPQFVDYMANRYHKAGDEWSETLDLSGAAADVELARRALLLAGNARDRPGWLPGKRPEFPAPPAGP